MANRSPSPKELPRQVSNPQPLPNVAKARDTMQEMWKTPGGNAKSGHKEAIAYMEQLLKGIYGQNPSSGDFSKLLGNNVGPDKKPTIVKQAKEILDIAKKPKANSKSPLKSSQSVKVPTPPSSSVTVNINTTQHQPQLEQKDSTLGSSQSSLGNIFGTTQQQQTRVGTPPCTQPENPQQPQQGEDSRMAKSKIVLSILLCALVVLLLILWLFGESFSLMQTVTKTDAQGVKTEKREFHVVKLILMIVGAIVGGCIGYLIAKPYDDDTSDFFSEEDP